MPSASRPRPLLAHVSAVVEEDREAAMEEEGPTGARKEYEDNTMWAPTSPVAPTPHRYPDFRCRLRELRDKRADSWWAASDMRAAPRASHAEGAVRREEEAEATPMAPTPKVWEPHGSTRGPPPGPFHWTSLHLLALALSLTLVTLAEPRTGCAPAPG